MVIMVSDIWKSTTQILREETRCLVTDEDQSVTNHTSAGRKEENVLFNDTLTIIMVSDIW